MGAGSTSAGGREDAGDGRALVILGWFTQPRLVSDMRMHNLYISRTVISNTETNRSNVQIKIFFSTFNTFSIIKVKKKKLTG